MLSGGSLVSGRARNANRSSTAENAPNTAADRGARARALGRSGNRAVYRTRARSTFRAHAIAMRRKRAAIRGNLSA